MKKLILLFWFALGVVLTGCQSHTNQDFAIYLLADEPTTAGVQKTAASTSLYGLRLQPAPILTSADIVSYDKTSHEITLTPSAYRRIQAIFPTPVRVDGIPFVVCVGDERIYTGSFWTPLSSLSYDGVIIMQPFDPGKPVIQISLGYPGPDAFTGKDPRSDRRILNSLQRIGILK